MGSMNHLSFLSIVYIAESHKEPIISSFMPENRGWHIL